MAFASVVARNGGNSGGNTTTHSLKLPDGSNVAGRYVLMAVGYDGTVTPTWPSDYPWAVVVTLVSAQGASFEVRGRVITGAEGYAATGATISVTTAENESSGHASILIKGHSCSTNPPTVGTTANGASTQPNPPNCNPGTAKDYLWIEAVGNDGNVSVTGASANFSNLQNFRYAASTGAGAATAEYALNAASLDPAVMTMGNDGWMVNTIAIHPGTEGMGYTLLCAAGHFTLTGKPQSLLYDRKLSAAHGVFTLTGKAATLKPDRKITAATGYFTLTGKAVTFKADRLLTAGFGSFVLTGEPATLTKVVMRLLECGTGYFTLGGQAATLKADRKLTAGWGSFTLTGRPQQLLHHHVLQAAPGQFALTGETAQLLHDFALLCAPGVFTLTGEPVTFPYDRVLRAGTGYFTLTGQQADLHKTGVYLLACDTGYFVLAGQGAGLLLSRKLVAGPGSFVLTGEPATTRVDRKLTAAPGYFSLDGRAASLLADRKLTAAPGLFTFTGFPANLLPPGVVYELLAGTGYFTLDGEPARLLLTRRLQAAPGLFTLDGQAARLLADRRLDAGTGLFVVTGFPATLRVVLPELWVYFVGPMRDGPTYWHRSRSGFTFWQHPHGG